MFPLFYIDDSELEAAERSCESQASEDSASEIVEEKSKSNKSQVVGKFNMGIMSHVSNCQSGQIMYKNTQKTYKFDKCSV